MILAEILQCILCEKPSAAKNYANALGGFSGTFNGKRYEIVNSVGHIFELLPPDEQVDETLKNKYKSWDIGYLPWNKEDLKWKKKLSGGFSKTYSKIKECMEKADEIVIATDDDPSGEGTLLADEIIKGVHPKGKHYYRSFHTDESIKEIQKAMMNLTDLGTNPLTDPDYIKADFRSKWDFLSIQWTRIFTKLGDGKSVLRQGRLKSYMVLAVGNQIKLVNEYQKTPFYQARFKDEAGNIYTSKKAETYDSKDKCPIGNYEKSEIIIDKTERKTTPPPALYDLNMLSSSLAPLGFKAKQVLDIYQKMYEDRDARGEGIVSYPRTDDKKITPEQFWDFVKIAPKIAKLLGIDESILTHKKLRPTHVSKSNTHGANRPGGNVPPSMDWIEHKYGKCGKMIYEFLARNSLAMLCEDYEYDHQTGHLTKYPDFTGYTNLPIKNGFKEIFNDDKKKDELDSGKPLGKQAVPFIYEGFPPKPSWPTAKWLARELKKNDVGTGATRTSIYADVTNAESKYPLLSEEKGKISMTVYGEMSYLLLKNTHIGDVKITEGLQQQMREVAKGADPNIFLSQIADMIKEDILTVKSNAKMDSFVNQAEIAKDGNPADTVLCPVCGKKMIRSEKGYICSGVKDKSCTYGVLRTVASKKLTDKQLQSLITKGKTGFIKGFKSKSGKEFSARLRLNKEHKIEFDFK